MPLAVKILALLALALAVFWAVVQYRARAEEAQAEASHPPEGQLIEVNGHTVHAVVMGSGPDVVLIHGASGNTRDMTLSLAPRLAREFRVFVFDRPGLGYTDRLNHSGATITQQADLLSAAAAQLGANKPVVVGHSYGGAVALAWAVHHPENLSALVPLSAASHTWTTGLSTYYKILSHPMLGPLIIPLMTAFVPESRVEQAVGAVFTPDAVPEGYMNYFGPGLTLRRKSLRANALQRANLLDEIDELVPHYPQIDVPTEILHGAADDTVGLSIHSEPLAKAIPGATLTTLDGAGHMIQHSKEDAVVNAIRRAAQRAGLRRDD
ncbi:alpha/beta hydrolase [Roseovarius sp. HI0049]|nr:alpha/beta hydrolase [Roseovarius sp. HI0049]